MQQNFELDVHRMEPDLGVHMLCVYRVVNLEYMTIYSRRSVYS